MKIHPTSADQAMERLKAGNARFASNVRSVESIASQGRRQELAAGQSPFAIVLSCSDSRAPSELLFDCGLGDLFVVRVAGNVVAPSLIGSVEFAVAMFGTQLVVVMGHTACGAIAATLAAQDHREEGQSPNIRDIVERILPAVADIEPGGDPQARMRRAIRANVRASVNHLQRGSRLLEERCRNGGLQIVGAEYELETGLVQWLS